MNATSYPESNTDRQEEKNYTKNPHSQLNWKTESDRICRSPVSKQELILTLSRAAYFTLRAQALGKRARKGEGEAGAQDWSAAIAGTNVNLKCEMLSPCASPGGGEDGA